MIDRNAIKHETNWSKFRKYIVSKRNVSSNKVSTVQFKVSKSEVKQINVYYLLIITVNTKNLKHNNFLVFVYITI
jgi:uncharacterized Zn-finger protein